MLGKAGGLPGYAALEPVQEVWKTASAAIRTELVWVCRDSRGPHGPGKGARGLGSREGVLVERLGT